MGDLLGSPRVAPPFSLPFFPISIDCGRDVNALASTPRCPRFPVCLRVVLHLRGRHVVIDRATVSRCDHTSTNAPDPIRTPQLSVYDNKPIFELSQEQLFKLCDNSGVFMYQTHPFRKGVIAGEPRFMHGAESFNGHFHHENINMLAQKFCEENSLVKYSGTDYHCPGQPITGGVYLPDDINDEKTLVKYVASEKCRLIEEELLYQSGRKIYLEEKR